MEKNSLLWILTVVASFTYPLGRTIEFENGPRVSESEFFPKILLVFLKLISPSLKKFFFSKDCFLIDINATLCSGYNCTRSRRNMAVSS